LDYTATYKIVILGDHNTGKTTLAHRFLTNEFSEEISMTLGVEFQTKVVEIGNERIKLQIWDFAGEERFRFLLPSYIKGTSGGIFMYDITNYASLAHVNEWFSIVQNELSYKIPIIIVGGKSDLFHHKEVSTKKAMELVRSKNADGFIECSSKTGENVNKVFNLLTKLILQKSPSS